MSTLEQACAEFIAPLEVSPDTPVPLTAYQDIAGVWTIGYGHTGPDVHEGLTWTIGDALAALADDVAPVLAAVVGWNARHPWGRGQVVAMVSLAYNIGLGGFHGSSVLRYHNAGDFRAAADSFLLWDKAHIDGTLRVVPGLLNRRHIERREYLAGVVVP